MMNTCVKVRPLAGLAMLLTILLLGGIMPKAHASHFRYGSLSWKARPDIGANTAELSLSDAFRRDGYSGSGADGYPVTGDIIHENIGATNLSFGDGSSTGELAYLVIAYDLTANYVYCKAIADPNNLLQPIIHKYGGSGPWIANIDSSARIAASINSPGGEYRVQTNINFATTNSSPVSTLPAVVNCPEGQVCTFLVPAASSEGDTLGWRLAAASEDGNLIQPPGLSADSKGTVKWNTTGLTTGLYSCQVVVEAHDPVSGAYKTQIGVDFLINVTPSVGFGVPPVFTQTAPVDGAQFDIATGKNLAFVISVQNNNPGGLVTLNAVGLPAGATMSPALPITGSSVSSTFSWTPTALQTGPVVVVFTATDAGGRQTNCSLIFNGLIDSDGDGIPDDWELHGVTYNGKFVDLPAMGADPNHKDVFVQIDYMVDPTSGHSHKPNPAAIALIQQSFANAPVTNPDGVNGIALHVSIGDAVPEVSVLGAATPTGDYDWTAFTAIEKIHFPIELSLVEHYCLFAHQYEAASNFSSGVARGIPSSDFLVTLGGAPDHVGSPSEQAGTFMHELGHNLGLRHGGGDDINYKPNYLSIMNHSFQLEGLHKDGRNGLFDYSRFDLPPLNKSVLYEANGLSGGAAISSYGTIWYTSSGQESGSASGYIDWNGNGILGIFDGLLPVAADIDNGFGQESKETILTSFNDWPHLVFSGGVIGAGIPLPQPMATPADELDLATAATIKTFPPEGLSARPGRGSMRLAWTAAGPVAEYTYKVYGSVAGGQFKLLTTTGSPLVSYSGLKAGSAYSYYVTAVDVRGTESDASVTLTAQPL